MDPNLLRGGYLGFPGSAVARFSTSIYYARLENGSVTVSRIVYVRSDTVLLDPPHRCCCRTFAAGRLYSENDTAKYMQSETFSVLFISDSKFGKETISDEELGVEHKTIVGRNSTNIL